MEVAIVGGGIAGLALALKLHERGIGCRVYEVVPEVKEIGVGITMLPHAMRELEALGLQAEIERIGIENRESRFFNRFGQLIYSEPRGRHAGYASPEVGVHRGRLHMTLLRAAQERLGAAHILCDRRCLGVAQEGGRVRLALARTSTGETLAPAYADVAVACDGINSTVRKQFYPEDNVVFTGINTWRGITVHEPILDGRTYLRIGSINTGKLVIYPIIDDVDGQGNQLINWVAEIQTRNDRQRNDWNKPGRLEDFAHLYATWVYDWLDVPEMLRTAELVLEYPMVDREPVTRWSFGRVTLAGDAAHPMYPRGSNGGAQALIDARVLADALARHDDPEAALKAYEQERLGPTAAIVRTNRTQPPDFLNIKVEELVGDRPFDDLDRYITQDELRELAEQYKRVAGFALDKR